VADSETVSETVVFRPQRLRRICWVLAGAVVIVFTLISFGLHGSLGDGAPGSFQRGDQAAMIGLGLLFAAGILLFTRPRVTADADGIRIRNALGGYDLPWEVVRAVRFNRGAPWAALELEDDELVAMLAVQAADKEYAVQAVRSLRTLLEANRAAHAAAADGD
jgi:Bacterial PH domain